MMGQGGRAMMVGNERADAIFAVVQSQTDFSKLSQAEIAQVRSQLRAVWATDLAYIQTHAEVRPGTLLTPAGASVVTAGGPTSQTGSVTTSSAIQGLGNVQ